MNDIIKALKNAQSISPWISKNKLINKDKRYERERKAKACVHFLTNVPNSKEGWAFINQMKKYLHKGRYSIRLKGRGSRKEHGNQSFLPIPHAEHYSIYIDQKIMDGNNPAFYALNEYKIRQKLRNLRSEIDELLK